MTIFDKQTRLLQQTIIKTLIRFNILDTKQLSRLYSNSTFQFDFFPTILFPCSLCELSPFYSKVERNAK